MYTISNTLVTTLRQRRQRLAQQLDVPVILWSGMAPARNFPANRFPFRASSHFLYFAGLPLENSAIRLTEGKLELFKNDPEPDSALWHGEMPTRSQLADHIGANAHYNLDQLPQRAKDAATVALSDLRTYKQQCQILQRAIFPNHTYEGTDLDLVKAIIQLRLCHDAEAIAQLRQAAAVTVAAHRAGMKATLHCQTEGEIRSVMEGVIIAHNMSCAYNSIVTVCGEVLHNEQYHHSLQPGDLLLADVGAETPLGWAADVTRTWPVSGQFSSTQRDIYDLVLAAHDACIAQIRPGVEYEDIHLLAAGIIAQGLVDLGILRGYVEDLVAQDAHALFFPHGIGHLLGLDVHDMEDLGDLAGYAIGRNRSGRFGLGYLRLNRPLGLGMVVTVEPGFYQVPAILNDPDRRARYQNIVNWERLEQFSDVRGIRIEDDVLVTESGSEVLTAALPNAAADVEAVMNSSM